MKRGRKPDPRETDLADAVCRGQEVVERYTGRLLWFANALRKARNVLKRAEKRLANYRAEKEKEATQA